MTTLTQSTKPIKESEVKRNWILIDVSGKILGRIAPLIARYLQGKQKSNYVQYLDMGDNVVVINARQVAISGKKAQTKIYTRFSGYPGGLKRIPYETMQRINPTEIIKHAVSGMLPKNKLRDQRIKRLFIFADANHPYKDALLVK